MRGRSTRIGGKHPEKSEPCSGGELSNRVIGVREGGGRRSICIGLVGNVINLSFDLE
jgi:hypothetical protein